MKYLLLLGRICYSLIFIMAGLGHFAADKIAYASAQGVPMASVLVPMSGVLAIAGGLSIAAGFKAKWGAFLIILFLVPVTLMMHNFWAVTNPQIAQMQLVNFMKNLSLIGGAIYIACFGSGALSVDAAMHHKPTKQPHSTPAFR